MTKLFLDVLNLSIAASWLICAVLLLRFVLKKFVPKWTICLVWALVGIRLVVPFSFESELSLVPSRETLNPSVLLDGEASHFLEENNIFNLDENSAQNEVSTSDESVFVTDTPNIQAPTKPSIPQNPPSATTNEPQKEYIDSGFDSLDKTVNPILQNAEENRESQSNTFWLDISAYVWIFGIAAMLVYATMNYALLKRRVAVFVPEGNGIRRSENVASPFILGVFKPKIYLPFGLSEENERNIIAHERAHLSRGDHLIKPFSFLILAFYWFNPLCWAAYILLCRDIELACDEKVVENMDLESRKGYANALLECGLKKSFISACPVAFGEVSIKARVVNALNYKKPIFWVIVVAIILITAVALLFLTDPQDSNSVSDISSETSSEVSSEISSEVSSGISSEISSEGVSETSSESSSDEASEPESEENSSLSSEQSDISENVESSEASSEVIEDSSDDIDVSSEISEDSSEVSEPEVSEPEISESEVSEPEISEPEVSEPEISEPEVSEPEISEPEVSEPEVSEPEISEPENKSPMKNTSHQTPDSFDTNYGWGSPITSFYITVYDIAQDIEGDPIQIREKGLKIWLCDSDGEKIDYLYTNSEGVARFDVTKGIYRFYFEGNERYVPRYSNNSLIAYTQNTGNDLIVNFPNPTKSTIYTYEDKFEDLTVYITDSETGLPIENVKCDIPHTEQSFFSDADGKIQLDSLMNSFYSGAYLYEFFCDAEGYDFSKTYHHVASNEIHIQLKKSETFEIKFTILDAATGEPIENVNVSLGNYNFAYSFLHNTVTSSDGVVTATFSSKDEYFGSPSLVFKYQHNKYIKTKFYNYSYHQGFEKDMTYILYIQYSENFSDNDDYILYNVKE